MAASDAILLIAVCALAAFSIGAGVLVAGRRGTAAQVATSGLLIALACYAVLLAFYAAIAAMSFDGLCYPILQAPRRCPMQEHLQQVLLLLAVGTAPLLPALFAISTIAGLITMRLRRGRDAVVAQRM